MLVTVNYGNKVRTARQNKKVNQAELSRIAGISQQDISDLENGKIRNMATYKVLAVNKALDLDILDTCINTDGYTAAEKQIARKVLTDIYGIELEK